MEPINENIVKIKKIFLPFVGLNLSFLFVYTFLHWLLILETRLISIDEMIIDFALPGVLSSLFVFFWLRPKIKQLNLGTDRKSDLYYLIPFVAILLPVVIAQIYINNAVGKLVHLENISFLDSVEYSKYYTISDYYLDKSNVSEYYTYDISGKYNQDFNMYAYYTIPIFFRKIDTASNLCNSWYCKRFFKRIPNDYSYYEKDSAFKIFAFHSKIDLNWLNLNRFQYLKRTGNNDDGRNFILAVKNNQKYATTEPNLLIPVNEPFDDRAGNGLLWVIIVNTVFSIIFWVMIWKIDLKPTKKIVLKKEKKEREKEILLFKELFIPRIGSFATLSLIYVNILIFILFVIFGSGFFRLDTYDLLKWGALYEPYVKDGQWWRLITSSFLHAGFEHIIYNLIGFMVVGIFLEPLIGHYKFLLLFILSAFFASIISMEWNENVISIGASGGIMGLNGALIGLWLTKRTSKFIGTSIFIFFSSMILMNLLIGLRSNIDTAAHIGGLFSGVLFGVIMGLSFDFISMKKNVIKLKAKKEKLDVKK